MAAGSIITHYESRHKKSSAHLKKSLLALAKTNESSLTYKKERKKEDNGTKQKNLKVTIIATQQTPVYFISEILNKSECTIAIEKKFRCILRVYFANQHFWEVNYVTLD